MKVSELEGRELCKWVALAQGWELISFPIAESGDCWRVDGQRDSVFIRDYDPVNNNAQAGVLLGEYCSSLNKIHDALYEAEVSEEGYYYQGNTWRIAICRALVASKYVEPINLYNVGDINE